MAYKDSGYCAAYQLAGQVTLCAVFLLRALSWFRGWRSWSKCKRQVPWGFRKAGWLFTHPAASTKKSRGRVSPGLSAVVEREFVRPLFNGDNLFPFWIGESSLAVVPYTREKLLGDHDIEEHLGGLKRPVYGTPIDRRLRGHCQKASIITRSFPSNCQYLFFASSTTVLECTCGCAKLRNSRALVSNGLYWSAMRSEQEANYLSAVLNAPITTELTRPLMSYDKDERDIHKHVWELPIPEYDSSNKVHQRIAQLGADSEVLASGFSIDLNLHFAATRRHIREFLQATDTGRELQELVFEMIG